MFSGDLQRTNCTSTLTHPNGLISPRSTSLSMMRTGFVDPLTSSGYSTETLQSSNLTGRDERFMRRWPPQSSNDENQNPNFSTPQNHTAKSNFTNAEIKSSTEKNDMQQKNNGAPSLKSTLSARNVFGGREILSQITEFCNEIKIMAIRAREKENSKQLAQENGVVVKAVSSKDSNNFERKPFGETQCTEI